MGKQKKTFKYTIYKSFIEELMIIAGYTKDNKLQIQRIHMR